MVIIKLCLMSQMIKKLLYWLLKIQDIGKSSKIHFWEHLADKQITKYQKNKKQKNKNVD